ncbi:MAG TPA: succinate dehydrogenase/fumarate reductase iron-sulfur subunit [Chloroflexota bacterium]|nr:succinate dehydrogenase/fumarate reductase iron-sulfur subunit [Chloroflexota bacterium]
MPADTIQLSVTRYDPAQDAAPRQQTYEIPYRDDMVVLDALNWIKTHMDGSVSYRWSCRMGICGSCGMNVNGTPRLGCSVFLRDYLPGPVLVEPLPNFPVIRDLVIDMTSFMEKLSSVKPWVISNGQEPALAAGEHRQTPAQVEQYRQFSMCINCMLCYAACPVIAIEPHFVGPAAIALARRYDLDSRDHAGQDRLRTVTGSDAIWDCSFIGECSAVCPKGVDPAKAIQQTKFESTLGMLLPWGGVSK